jgi:hypothetical protein
MKNKQAPSPVIVVMVASVLMMMAAACGGKSDDSGNGGQDQDGGQLIDSGQGDRTPEQVQDDIRAEIEALNSCNSVEDCVSVYIPGTCGVGYISADADRSNLDTLIAEYSAVGGLEPPCPAMCETGILSCEQNRCETRAASPSDPVGGEERSVCL